MRKMCVLLVSFLAGVVVLLTEPWAASSEEVVACCGNQAEAPGGQGNRPADATDHVCPLYPYAFFGSYCSYYAFKCPDTPVGLDTGCGKMGSCSDAMYTNCVDVSSREKKDQQKAKNAAARAGQKGPGKHHHDDYLAKGLQGDKPQPAVKDPSTPGDGMVTLQNRTIAELEADPKSMKKKPRVALYLFRVEPPKQTQATPPLMIGNGVEVSDAKYDVTIEYKDIVCTHGKVVYVNYKSNTYQVVMHKGTAVKDKSCPP